MSDDRVPKIFLFVNQRIGDDVTGLALAEDGVVVASHWSSNVDFLKHDLGFAPWDGDNWKHEKYDAHYPDGYELVWVDNPLTHSDCQAACQRNQERAANAETPRPSTGSAVSSSGSPTNEGEG